jgi:hypothetical protein
MKKIWVEQGFSPAFACFVSSGALAPEAESAFPQRLKPASIFSFPCSAEALLHQ